MPETYFHARCALSLARPRFTVLFGMGRVVPRRYGRQTVTCAVHRGLRKRQRGRSGVGFGCFGCDWHFYEFACLYLRALQGYRIKPHGQLVRVSLTHYCASTPAYQRRGLQRPFRGFKFPGISHLEASFPLRCFQRLSLPNLATRRCDWRHNRYTRDSSTPVLSY